MLGRWTAKNCVTGLLNSNDSGVPLNEIAVLAADDGAPEVFYKDNAVNCNISLSHSHGVAISAVVPEGTIIGCDLEKIEKRSPLFIEDYFTEREKSVILGDTDNQTSLLANLMWSAKESVVKALRVGLSVDTKLIEIICTPMGNEGEWHRMDINYPSQQLNLHGMWQSSSGYVITMVCDQPNFEPIGIQKGV